MQRGARCGHGHAPRQLSYQGLLRLLALTALTQNGDLILRHATTNVFWALNAKQRSILELPDSVSETQVWKTFDKVAQAVGFDVDETTGVVTSRLLDMTPDEVTTTIATAGIPDCCLPTRTSALDGTSHDSPFARRSSNVDGRPDVPEGQLPVEPDALAPKVSSPGFPRFGLDGRAQHTVDPDVREGFRGRKQGETNIYNGRELHLVCDVPELGGTPTPPFVRSVGISGAGDDRLDGGRRALEALTYKPEVLLADRGYPYLRGWGSYLLREGIAQVIDLHKDQRKVRPGPIPGTIWLDDSLASDATPPRLRDLPGFKRGMSTEEKLKLAALYDQRRPYLYRPMGRPNPTTGALRFRGPAVSGTVRCSSTAASMRLARKKSRPTAGCQAGTACGCGGTVTLHPQDYARTFQAEPYGTTRWVASYYRRSAIETANGELKHNRLAVGKRSILVRGNRRYSLLLGLLLAR